MDRVMCVAHAQEVNSCTRQKKKKGRHQRRRSGRAVLVIPLSVERLTRDVTGAEDIVQGTAVRVCFCPQFLGVFFYFAAESVTRWYFRHFTRTSYPCNLNFFLSVHAEKQIAVVVPQIVACVSSVKILQELFSKRHYDRPFATEAATKTKSKRYSRLYEACTKKTYKTLSVGLQLCRANITTSPQTNTD